MVSKVFVVSVNIVGRDEDKYSFHESMFPKFNKPIPYDVSIVDLTPVLISNSRQQRGSMLKQRS